MAYIRKNLQYIGNLSASVPLTVLSKHRYRDLLVIEELYRQQLEMYKSDTKSISDRIVSISQPHVRPIVRGKAAAKTEFGMKLSISVVDGISMPERMSWNAYNEGCDLVRDIERYRERYGHYPESVHADKIYRTLANRMWCKERDIRLSGVPLGRRQRMLRRTGPPAANQGRRRNQERR